MATPNGHGWDWFAAPAERPDEALVDTARAFARAFAGTDGGRVLAHLNRLTRERYLAPDASDAALRHLEGQRALVAHVAALIELGRDGPSEDTTS